MKSMPKYVSKFYLILFFILIFQYLLIYVFGDIFSLLDDVSIILLLPIFVLSFKEKDNHVIFLTIFYLVIKALVFILIENRFVQSFQDLFSWYLKPIILFWSFYYFFGRLDKSILIKSAKAFTVIFYFAIFYGWIQFIGWFFFRIDLPMRSDNFINTGTSATFDFIRVSSFFGQTLWFGYFCVLAGVYFLLQKKYFNTFLAFTGILLTFSRWAFFLFVLMSIYIIISRFSIEKRIAIYSVIIISGLLLIPKIIPFYNDIWGNYGDQSIKIYGIQKAVGLFSQNPLGYGFGSYGTNSSIGSFTYEISNFDGARLGNLADKKSGIEAFMFIALVQAGIDGLLIFLAPFILGFYRSSISKVFFLFLILLPIIDIYSNVILITTSFLIQLNNSNKTILTDSAKE